MHSYVLDTASVSSLEMDTCLGKPSKVPGRGRGQATKQFWRSPKGVVGLKRVRLAELAIQAELLVDAGGPLHKVIAAQLPAGRQRAQELPQRMRDGQVG